jgi:hypothetical protein
MTTPWGKPPAASFEFGLADHDGVLAFFLVGGLHNSVSTSFGERDAVRCSIIMLDGPEAGKAFEDILIFNSRPVARLRSVPGQIVLARIGMGQAKAGNNKPVELYEATPQDEALAARYHQAFPNKLREVLQATVYSFQLNESKTAQGDRVRSEPHPTHAGSRAPANRSQPPAQAQPGFQPGSDWAQPAQPTQAPPPWADPPQQTQPTQSIPNQATGSGPDPWDQRTGNGSYPY